MRPISQGELARLARTMESVLPQTATVTQPGAETGSPMGETIPGAPETFTMPCQVLASGGSPQELEIAAQVGAITTWTISHPRAYAVKATAQLVVDGRTYQAKGTIQGEAYEAIRRVVCIMIGG